MVSDPSSRKYAQRMIQFLFVLSCVAQKWRPRMINWPSNMSTQKNPLYPMPSRLSDTFCQRWLSWLISTWHNDVIIIEFTWILPSISRKICSLRVSLGNSRGDRQRVLREMSCISKQVQDHHPESCLSLTFETCKVICILELYNSGISSAYYSLFLHLDG